MDQPPSASIRAHFATRTDPRSDHTKQHQVLDIRTMALCGVICGAARWTEIEQFGHAKRSWLGTLLDLPHGIPSQDTVGRVCAARDPTQVQHCFLGWVQAVVARTPGQVTPGQVVVLDGTTVRRAHDRATGTAALPLVSAWATEHRLVLGQVTVEDTSNEITALPDLVQLLALRGCIVTIDAMGGQTAIAQTMIDHGADDVLALTGTQPTLEQAGQTMFAEAQATGVQGLAHDQHTTVEQGHGRLENGRHWVGAIAFREDECRVRQGEAAQNGAVLRQGALTLLREERTATIGGTAKRRNAGWDEHSLLRVLQL